MTALPSWNLPPPGAFSLLPNGPGVTRLFATATLLNDGAILFAGGYGPTIAASAQAWLYNQSP